MRARNIKPGFFKNEELAEIEPLGRILYEGLWCMCDREGRLEDRPKKIKAEILPYDECDVDSLLDHLAGHQFITRYQVDGGRYIWIIKFKAHQNPHKKEPASVIPPFEGCETNPGPSGSSPGCSQTGLEFFETGPGNSGTGPGFSEPSPGNSGNGPADSRLLISESPKTDSRNIGYRDDSGSGPLKSLNDLRIDNHSQYALVAQYLRDAILANKPDASLPAKLEPWVNTVRLMVQHDRRPVSNIIQVIDWCQNDEFWSVNILNMEKLRKHFDRLELEMKRKKVVPFNGGAPKNRGDTPDGYGRISNLIVRAE